MKKSRCLRIVVPLAFALLMVIAVTVPAHAGTTGIIAGTVTDSATGEKLAGVNVIVEGTDLTTVTNAQGYYVITNVPVGEYTVTTSLVGYSDAVVEKVSVIMDTTSTTDFPMATAVAQEDTVIVTGSRPMILPDVVPTMHVVTSEQEREILGQPANRYQTPSIVLTQPGVVADADGFPHIRGGRVNQIAYLLDGIPITEPVTNGFGTNLMTVGMDKMEIFTGGYRPEYGNAISGVFNQVIKTGRSDPGTSLEMTGGSSAYSLVFPEIGGYTDSGLEYYVGTFIQRSDLEDMYFTGADNMDSVGKFSYPLGQKDTLSFLTASGDGEYQFPSSHLMTYGTDGLVDIAEEPDHQHQSYILNSFTLNHTINPASFFTVRPYYFRNRWMIDALSDDIGYWWDAESATTGLMFDYTNQLSDKHLVKAGGQWMSSKNRYWAIVPAYGDYEYTADTDTLQTAFFIQDQMKLSSKLGLEAGLRYDKMKYDRVINDDTAESQTSPRFGLTYAADSKTNWRFSWGKMIQFVYTQAIERNYVNPDWYDWMGLGNADVRPERATQWDIGWERQVGKDSALSVTPFYRQFTDMLQVRSLDPSDPEGYPQEFSNLGEGVSKGIEFQIRKRPSNNWSGWLSYTLASAKAQASNDRQAIISDQMNFVDWDQRHTVVGVLNLTRGKWMYSFMGEYGSGLRWNLATDDTPNCRRVASHMLFNVNMSRDIKGGWLPEGAMNLSIANVFNIHAVLDRDWDGEPSVRVQPRFAALSFTRQF